MYILLTWIFATLPDPINVAFTGKNASGSSPPTLNSKLPERELSEISEIDQSRECVVGLTVHLSDFEVTVGYEPDGRETEIITSYRFSSSFSSSYSRLTSHVPFPDGVGQQVTVVY
jgi:hypothetical protein